MQVQPPSKSQRSTPLTKKDSGSLSNKLKDVLKELDKTVALAFSAINLSGQRSEAFLPYSQQLDDILLRLRVWASDVNIQRPIVQGKPLPMREWTTTDCLDIIDARQGLAAMELHETLNQITADVTNTSHVLKKISIETNSTRATVDQDLQNAISNLQRSVRNLDQQTLTIHEQIATATLEEVRRALSGSGGLSARASVLTIDGGGVRSYSSILIIKALMEQIRFLLRDRDEDDEEKHEPSEMRPGDVFEYIIGSSSGGLIAIMLGRLNMTENECLKTFEQYSNEIIGHPQWKLRTLGGLLSPKYDSNRLLRATRHITRKFDPNNDDEKWKHSLFASSDAICKTAVIACSCKDGKNIPYMFRTYNSSESDDSKAGHIRNPGSAATCQIEEAARATSAAPQYFSPIVIGGNPFVDGGFGTNNPTFEAFNELTQSKVNSPLDPLIVSIGSGTGLHPSSLEKLKIKPKLLSNIYSAIHLATGTQRVHEEMSVVAREQRFGYFRFSVDEGLEDILLDSWRVRKMDGTKSFETINHIRSETTRYLQRQDVQGELRRCAQLLVDRLISRRSNPTPEYQQTFFSVPFSRNTHFVGRESILSQLDERLSVGNRMALVGIGGVGKSQIAIEYCYRFQDHHPGSWVFWVYAGTRTGFNKGYRAIADLVQITGRDEAGADVLRLVHEWLRRQSTNKWLLILDNADDPVLLGDSPKKGLAEATSDDPSPSLLDFVPQTRNGLILITTRDKAMARRLTGDSTSVLMIEPMLQQEARVLLHKMLAANWEAENADQLVQALDCIPLAFAQAAGFINATTPRFTMGKYLQELRKERGAQATLLYHESFDLRRESSAASSVVVTWQLGFDRIRRIAPSAARLLSLTSLFHPDQIQDYLLVQYDEDNTAKPDCQDENNLQFEEDISILRNYCFIATNEQGDLFSMHRLVQVSMKHWLESYGELERWKGKYLMILSGAFPTDPYANLAESQALFPHAEVAMDYQPTELEYLVHYTRILGNASLYATATGRHEVAEDMSKSALRCCKTLLDQKYSLTLPCALNLALIVQRQGEYKMSEDMIRSVYEDSEKVLGPEHPDTLTSASILVSALRLQGKLVECQNLVTQVLERCQKTLGLEHQDTLSNMSNLAGIHHDLGRDEEALGLQTSVFESRKKILGLEHPLTLSAMADLPVILSGLGRKKKAEKLKMQVVEKMVEVLGSEHPDTLSAMATLAGTLAAQSRKMEAVKVQMRVVEKREQILDSEFPGTSSAIVTLAATLLALGRAREAEKLQRLALENSIKVRGYDDSSSILAMSNLGSTYRAIGEYQKAEEILEQVLALRKERFGEEHPDTLLAMGSLAASYSTTGRRQEAQELFLRVLELRTKVLGEQDPQTQLAKERLLELNQQVLKEQQPEIKESEINLAEVRLQPTTRDLPVSEQERLYSQSLPPSPTREDVVDQRRKTWSWSQQARNVRHWGTTLRGSEQKADGSKVKMKGQASDLGKTP